MMNILVRAPVFSPEESVEPFEREDYLFTLQRQSGFLFCGQFIVVEAHVTRDT
jgi:hypothetical protein